VFVHIFDYDVLYRKSGRVDMGSEKEKGCSGGFCLAATMVMNLKHPRKSPLGKVLGFNYAQRA
jgi:hypothetical protein